MSDNDIATLAKHINDSGLQVPILVREDMLIVDGLRRTAAMSLLGFTSIDVFVPSTFVESIEHLRQTLANTTEALPLKPRRMYEIKRDLAAVAWVERGRLNRGIPRGGVRPPTSITGRGVAKHLTEVFGVSYSYLAAISRLFNSEGTLSVTMDPMEFREALEDLNEGRMRPGTLIAMLEQGRLFKGDIKSATAQRDALRGAIAAINGVLGGLAALGPVNKAISRDELVELQSALRRVRRLNNQMIKVVTEEMRHR